MSKPIRYAVRVQVRNTNMGDLEFPERHFGPFTSYAAALEFSDKVQDAGDRLYKRHAETIAEGPDDVNILAMPIRLDRDGLRAVAAWMTGELEAMLDL